jgi:ketosteroid isomerase-like protein
MLGYDRDWRRDEMAVHPNVARIRRAYEALRAGDADTIGSLLADDLVWHIPGRHRFSGDHNKATIMATYEKIMPEFSKTGQAVISTFNIDVEDVVASDEWAFARVHWNHTRDGKRFDQRGVEVYRLNADGRITEFWAFMRDTIVFDDFFA